MVGPIEKTSPTPGISGPAAAKTTQSIKNIVGKVPRSQIEVPNESLSGADNEPTVKPPESNSRGSVPLRVVPPQA